MNFWSFFCDAQGCIYVTGLNSLGFRASPPWSRAQCSKFRECNLSSGCGEKRISPSQQLNPPSGGKAPAAARPRWNYLHFVSVQTQEKKKVDTERYLFLDLIWCRNRNFFKNRARGRWKWISEMWLHLVIWFREINMVMEYSLEQILWEESGAGRPGAFQAFGSALLE